MIENMPNWIDLVFIIIVIVTIFFFHLSNGKPKYVTLLILIWSLLQSGLAYIGFYQVFDTMPPRFACMFIPIVLLFIYALQATHLLFVSFILVVGLLSSEIPIQQFGFEQPNRAVTYFPYVLLPAVVVPLVMYMHVTDIIKLRRSLN